MENVPTYEPWSAERTAQIIREHQGLEGPLLPILHALQEAFGYIDTAAEPLIAEALNISRAEVHGVVTFYHDFRKAPAGRHVLKLCRAEACQAAGGDALAARAQTRLGVAFRRHNCRRARHAGAGLLPRPVFGITAAMIDGRIVARLDDKKLEALVAETDR